jgi:hypothetical protein
VDLGRQNEDFFWNQYISCKTATKLPLLNSEVKSMGETVLVEVQTVLTVPDQSSFSGRAASICLEKLRNVPQSKLKADHDPCAS